MENERNKGEETGSENEPTSIQSVVRTGKALFEVFQDSDLQNGEFFEQYIGALQKKIYHDENQFLSRLERGYKALLEMVKR